ncbi:hypothetical protein FVEG_14673 [Fusarium verticillioides 7600]|uniref:Uncharacterized protein n=1 Tax=Gibberella moniliformis (strain M3125 / FGSC 7600) TaxID=334819 RepID=W7LA46_GIBM7|nr:hypothetical protein FVEG_14673 [Fusarium verticillioides 7600]EWG36473.1 hypothetical protein FVEG_14673 [Fusarium verticillioides 7600]
MQPGKAHRQAHYLGAETGTSDLRLSAPSVRSTTFLRTIHDGSTYRSLPKGNRNSLVLLLPHLVDYTYLEIKIDLSMDLP